MGIKHDAAKDSILTTDATKQGEEEYWTATHLFLIKALFRTSRPGFVAVGLFLIVSRMAMVSGRGRCESFVASNGDQPSTENRKRQKHFEDNEDRIVPIRIQSPLIVVGP